MQLRIDPARRSSPSFLVWTALWVVYIVWGSTYLAIRVVVETMPPLLSAGVRFVAAGSIMLVVLLVRRGRAGIRVSRSELLGSTLIGTALLLGGNGIVSIAEKDVPSALAALIIASVPLWVIVLRSITGDRVDRGTLISVAVGFGGVTLLVLPGESTGGAMIGPTLLVVLASIFWATGSFFAKRTPLPKDPFLSTGTQMLTGGLVILVAAAATGEFSGLDIGAFSAHSWAGLAYLIGAGSLLAFTAYSWLLQNAPISKVATYAYVNPVVAIGLGWLILSEDITPIILVGAAIIVIAVASIVRRESRVARAVQAAQNLTTESVPVEASVR